MFVMKCTPSSFYRSIVFLSLLGLSCFQTLAQRTNSASDLTGLPLEKLLDIEVTTVARKAERLSQSPAAISVITEDDIHRSGATSIPEALRLSPGIEAARLDANEW